ncbi:MAG: hypothetical protein WAR79_08940 [Melioribacteraceae bacterium]
MENGLNKINRHNLKLNRIVAKRFDLNYGLNDRYLKNKNNIIPERRILKLSKIHGSINFVKKNVPLIVPPTWNKTSNLEMVPVWKLAHNLISNSNKLVFIGYSLPTTDLYLKYLLICGIKNNYNLKKIKVICPDDEKGSTEQRYINFFDENFRNKTFEFISKKFEDYHYGR